MGENIQVLTIILMVILSISQANAQERYRDLRIDCGACSQTDDGIASWLTDENFVNSGENHLFTYTQNFSTMNSLRYFPNGQKNCYFLPFYSSDKFLFRAGFYYGNYDGLSRPPSFNLEIDGNFWVEVTTSTRKDAPIYHEIIYRTKLDSSQVCLVQTGDGIPFISSLEATEVIGDDMYRLMENMTALLLHSRITYGANNKTERLLARKEDWCNRIWKPTQMSEYLNIVSEGNADDTLYGENNPPWPVMDAAIQATNVSDSLYLSVKFSTQTTTVAYFVLYFRDPIFRYPGNPTAQVEIFVDSQKLGATVVPRWNATRPDRFHVVSLYPVQVNGSANVIISPAENSTLAPILNAMEVFSVVNMPYASKAGCFLNLNVGSCLVFLHLVAIIVSATELF